MNSLLVPVRDKTTAMSTHSTDLSILNKTSVRFATWVVRVTHGHTTEYSYTNKKTAAIVVVHKFECRLVGDSESKYVLATLKGTEKAVDTAKDKFKNGSVWILSQVKFEENTNQTYISSPLKVSVDLIKTTLQCCKDPELEKLLAKVSVPPRIATWVVRVTDGHTHEYTYTNKKTAAIRPNVLSEADDDEDEPESRVPSPSSDSDFEVRAVVARARECANTK